MDYLVYLFIKHVLRRFVVEVTYWDLNEASSYYRIVRTTPDGKSYIQTTRNRVGFLDNYTQKSGEFRKNKSDPALLKWHKL